MGQSEYDVEIQAAIRKTPGNDWYYLHRTVASLRSPAKPDVRIPMGVVNRLPSSAAEFVGRHRYPPADLIHRFDLRIPPGRRPEVVTVHDLPPLRFSDEGTLPRFALPSARRAAGVICPSRFAEAEVREFCGVERVWVIPYGLSSEFHDPSPLDEAQKHAMGISGRYIVHAAGATARKNLAGLAAAWQLVAERHPEVLLVLCGPPDMRRTALFARLPRVVMPGRLPLATIAGLMTSARAVVVPSTYEGFGLPALEGMAVGTPVVAANAGALPEVCGDAAHLVDPSGVGIAQGLDDILSDPDAAGRLAARGRERATNFDWNAAAAAHLRVYNEVLGT